MSELIYNKESVSTYKTNFISEKDKFSNTVYNNFKNSYLGTCSEDIITKMKTSLDTNYTNLEKSYANIKSFWDDYDTANDTLETSIESFTASCSEDAVNAYLNSFIGEITDYSSNNNLDTINKLMKYGDSINTKIDEYSQKYNIDSKNLEALVFVNGNKINSEDDISKIIDEGKEEVENYTKSLKDKGFPDDYATKLTTLHIYHPNWEFEVTKTGTTLEDAVNAETEDYTKNTTQKLSEADGSGRQPEQGWYTASKDSVKFYMDPSNSLDEKNIFQFEKLTYDSNTTEDQLSKSLEGSFMADKTYNYNGKTYTYEQTFKEVGEKNNVNSTYLASRALQEQGKSGSATAEMNGEDGKKYYNYYNFNAYGSTPTEVINNGYEYAKENNWDNPYKSIDGAASKISSDYIANGQDTVYTQKYNVTGDNKYDHQYMANISAPSSESKKTYDNYKKNDMLDSNFVFDIPVYD